MIVYVVGKYHSWHNTLPFRVRYWEENTHTLGGIKVPVQALDTINAYYTGIKVNKVVENLHQGLV